MRCTSHRSCRRRPRRFAVAARVQLDHGSPPPRVHPNKKIRKDNYPTSSPLVRVPPIRYAPGAYVPIMLYALGAYRVPFFVSLGAYAFPAVGSCDVSRWFFSKHSKKVVQLNMRLRFQSIEFLFLFFICVIKRLTGEDSLRGQQVMTIRARLVFKKFW